MEGSSTMPEPQRVAREDLARHLAFAQGALGAAGHVVEPELEEIALRVVAGEISEAEGDRLAIAHIQSKRRK